MLRPKLTLCGRVNSVEFETGWKSIVLRKCGRNKTEEHKLEHCDNGGMIQCNVDYISKTVFLEKFWLSMQRQKWCVNKHMKDQTGLDTYRRAGGRLQLLPSCLLQSLETKASIVGRLMAGRTGFHRRKSPTMEGVSQPFASAMELAKKHSHRKAPYFQSIV